MARIFTALLAGFWIFTFSLNAAAQLHDLIGIWTDESGEITFEFLDDGTYILKGVPGVGLDQLSGRFVVPQSGERIVTRLTELGKGAVFELVPGDAGLTLSNEELFHGAVRFSRPTNIWMHLGTSPSVLVLLTILFSGGAALLTGQALANGWQPLWKCIPYGVLLGLGDRFLNFALFQGPLLSLAGFVLDSIIITVLTIVGYSFVKAGKMTGQYPWLYQRKGLFGWDEKAQGEASDAARRA